MEELSVALNGVTLLDRIGFSVAPGEILGLVGESGSGKSLTLRAILRLLPPAARVAGRVLWQGQDALRLSAEKMHKLRGRGIAAVFQEPMAALDPLLPVSLPITESLAEHLGLRGRAARAQAIELLDLVAW